MEIMDQKKDLLIEINSYSEKIFNRFGDKLLYFEESSQKFAAITYTLISSLFFVLVSIFVKMLHGIGSSQILYFRCLISLALNSFLIKCNKHSLYTKEKSVHKLLIARCIITGISQYCFYQAMYILNTSPFWTTVLAGVILKETISSNILVTIVCSFTGILLVIQPNFLKGLFGILDISSENSGSSEMGFIYGSLFSISFGLATVIIKKLSGSIHNSIIIHYGLISSIIFSGVDLLQTGEFSSKIFLPQNLIYIFLLSFFNYAAQMLYSRAITLEKASKLAPLQQTQVVFGFILEICIFQKDISILSLLGAGLIILGNLQSIRGK